MYRLTAMLLALTLVAYTSCTDDDSDAPISPPPQDLQTTPPGVTMSVQGTSAGAVSFAMASPSLTIEPQLDGITVGRNSFELAIADTVTADSVYVDLDLAIDSLGLPAEASPVVLVGGRGTAGSVVATLLDMTASRHITVRLCVPTQSGANKSTLAGSAQNPILSYIVVLEVLHVVYSLGDDRATANSGMTLVSSGGNTSSDTMIIFVHGRASDWTKVGPILAPQCLSWHQVFVDYDWRCHISSNGLALRAALDALPALNTKTCVYFAAHSMGGLVTRKCLREAEISRTAWLSKVRKLLLFSSPSDGGMIFGLSMGPLPQWHAGDLDLRFGYMNDDWKGLLAYDINRKTAVPLPSGIVVHATVCANDGVVEQASAFDTKHGSDDLLLGAPQTYMLNIDYRNTAAVVIPAMDCGAGVVCRLTPVWEVVAGPLGSVVGAVGCAADVISCGLYAHGSYKLPEGRRLFAAWLGFSGEGIIDGVPAGVDTIITPALLDSLVAMGMTIHTGFSPPDVEGNYYANSNLLVGSNLAGDASYIGTKTYGNYSYRFSNQTPDLTITVQSAFQNDSSTSMGNGAFISGSNGNFSLYIQSVETSLQPEGHTVTLTSVGVISGTAAAAGISPFRKAFMITGKLNDIYDDYIDVGEGRVISESDGLAERVSSYPYRPQPKGVAELARRQPALAK